MATQTQNFTKKVHTTQTGLRFGRALFSNGNSGLSPKLIADTLRLLGLNVPKDVVITLDVAQVIISGAALYSAVQDYETINDAKDVLDYGAGTVNALTDLAIQCGWLDANNQYVQMVEVGSDVAMLISSWGTDVRSYVSLALHIASFEAGNKANAVKIAKQQLINGYHSIVDPQASAAAEVFKQYQESANLPDSDPNKLSVFGFIAKMASVAPDLWPQYFPKFNTWMPETVRTYTAQSRSTTWYGSTATDSESFSWVSLYKMSDDQIRQIVFNGLCYPTLYPFQLAENAFGQTKAPLSSLALLATLSPMKMVNAGNDNSTYLDGSFLTPYELGDMSVQNYLDSLTDPTKGLRKQIGISVNGKAAVVGKNAALSEAVKLWQDRDLVRNADILGRIDILRNYQSVSKLLKQKYTYPNLPYDAALGGWNEIGAPENSPRGAIVDITAGAGRAWRDPKNYIGALGMIDTLQRDAFFRNSQLVSWMNQTFSFMKDITWLDQTHRKTQLLQTIRSMNYLALFNIANFFGTTPDKLIRKTVNGNTVYAVKGN